MFRMFCNKNSLIVLVICLVGFITYFNALFNGFVLDDLTQIVHAEIIHSSKNIPLFFISSIRNSQKPGVLLNHYYKPVMFSIFAVLYTLEGGKPFLFHLFQVFIHISNALLVFFFLKKFFSEKISFFLSLVFLLHPINEEAVAYIANLQDVLFFFFGMLALVVLQYSRKKILVKIILCSICILMSLFSKETGVLFILILGVFLFMHERKNLEKYIIPVSLIIVLYAVLRIIASQFYFLTLISLPIMKISLQHRLIYVPKVLFFYIHEFFLPTTVIVFKSTLGRGTTLQKIVPDLLSVFLFVLGTIGISRIIWIKRKKYFHYYLFFLFWFFLGLGFHSQIFPLDAVVAERWFYFSMVGLLGMIGCVLELFSWKKIYLKWAVVIVGVCVLAFYFYQTITMNPQWKNKQTIHPYTIKF